MRNFFAINVEFEVTNLDTWFIGSIIDKVKSLGKKESLIFLVAWWERG